MSKKKLVKYMRSKMEQISKKVKIKQLVEIIGLLIVLVCIGCSIKMEIVGRTLWLDEAMLAISFNTRSFFRLFQPPLAWNQSAPVGYLFVVKVITSICGNAEWVYRLFSVIAYIALLCVFYVLCEQIVNAQYPMLCTAGVANVAILLEYSNMFKPYIVDALCVLLVILVYNKYRKKKWNVVKLSIAFAILIWCSNPVAFMSGGVVATEVLTGIIKKDKKRTLYGMIIGASIVASFLIMYILWLAPTISGTNLSQFWEGYQFPLLWTNRQIVQQALLAIKTVCVGIGPAWKIILLLDGIGIVMNIIWKKNEYVWSIIMAMGITLIASNRGFFPMSDRLFLFCVPVLILLGYISVHWIIELIVKVEMQKWIALLMVGCFTLSGQGILKYHTGEAYIEGEEANEALDYIESNINVNDKLYVYYPAIPIFMYRLGYDTTSVCGYDNNVILGKDYFYEENQNTEDIELLSEQNGVYLLFSHVVDYQPTDNLMNVLNAQGSLEKIKDKYLFYYSSDKSNFQGKFSYEIVGQEMKGNTCTLQVRINNDGDTYLNNGYENYVFGVDSEDSVAVDDLEPGESKEITISFLWDEQSEVELQLYNVGKYAMEEVGVNPLVIKR